MTAKRLFPGPALGSEPAGDNRITLRNANPETLTECTLKRYSLTSFKKKRLCGLSWLATTASVNVFGASG
jgi:hypothetical protein